MPPRPSRQVLLLVQQVRAPPVQALEPEELALQEPVWQQQAELQEQEPAWALLELQEQEPAWALLELRFAQARFD